MERLAAFSPAVRSLEESIARAQVAERLGYESVWTTQLPDARDAALVLAAYAANTKRIGLGTAVLPIYTRHPTAMAQMTATLDELSGGRFILGIGISHKVTVESMWGLRLEHPVDAMREYLTILRSSLNDGVSSFEGTHFTARWGYSAPRRGDVRIMISALNPRMLHLAGELADGVILYMCSPRHIREQIIPAIKAGRESAGKAMDGFEIVAGIDSCLTSDRAAALEVYRSTIERYASLPYYRKMMDASGYADELASGQVSEAMIDELAAIGDEGQVRAAIHRFRDAGVTLPGVGPFSKHKAAAGFEATLEAAARA